MTLRPLTDDFAMRSADTTTPPHLVDRRAMLVELEEELDKRIRVYPGHVERRLMSREDAEHHIVVWRAIIADFHRDEAAAARRDGHGYAIDPAPYTHDFDARVRELRRELATRRNAYPKWIASPANPLTAETATRKLTRLDAVHWRYWMHLFAFDERGDPLDLTRLAHAAEREMLNRAAAWRDASARGGIPAAIAARWRNHWQVIVLLLREVRDGTPAWELVRPTDMPRLAATAWGVLDHYLTLGTAGDPAATARVAQLEPLFCWLDRLARQHAPLLRKEVA
ncbi:hypothetical protein [Sphingomonas parapaucimobilis]|uniref:Uncharacterized protein n=1 Tax=Sphingomonas parapaucimobilis NBRC 15100 TaxID=1219049 RepID=A0A0A1W6I2_9SPHN|nr:hypothetical protein [Sphingomonas parapaucimobilis]GAM00741.1 hypothetical protein SP5_035_01430 [Sphingomonas parapaucimobilis NBRC 15100]